MIKLAEASLQLPATYPQLPALLIGQIGILIWRIVHHYNHHSCKLMYLNAVPDTPCLYLICIELVTGSDTGI